MSMAELLLVYYLVLLGVNTFFALVYLCLRDAPRRGTSPRTALTVVRDTLIVMVILVFWPIADMVAIFGYYSDFFCPHVWHNMRGTVLGVAVCQLLGGLFSGQHNQAVEVSTGPREDACNWHRRGWLVLLRARHQRTTAARISSRWRWAGCCSKRRSSKDMFMRVVPPPRAEHDIEGGQGSVVHDNNNVSELRQLLIKVVEYEEDGVFRSIVGYL